MPIKKSKIEDTVLRPNQQYEQMAMVQKPKLLSLKSKIPVVAKKRTQVDGNKVDISEVKASKTDLPEADYAASGLKLSLHGTAYQLKLLMLFLKRGLDKGYAFRLATEMDAAEKFDDVVFEYRQRNKSHYRFLQAKHKQDEAEKITSDALFKEKKGQKKQKNDFSLQKYFNSYRKIKEKSEFKDGEIDDVIIYTNIGFDVEVTPNGDSPLKKLAKKELYVEKVETTDDVLDVGGERYRLASRSHQDKRDKVIAELTPLFERGSDLSQLATLLAQALLGKKDSTENRQKIGLNEPLFKQYHRALVKEVINIDDKRFHANFLEGQPLSLPAQTFRKEFREAVHRCLQSKKNLTTEDRVLLDTFTDRPVSKIPLPITSDRQLADKEQAFWQQMSKKTFNLSEQFGKTFKLESNPQLTDSQKFADEIAALMKKSSDNSVNIERRKKVIASNIDKLAGHVLVYRNEEEKSYFSTRFLQQPQSLPDKLQTFRDHLKTALEQQKVPFDTLSQYQLTITQFQTCQEEALEVPFPEQTELPEKVTTQEIEVFIDELVFAVNQPNEIELGELINSELGEEFNLIDSDLVASQIQNEMFNWFKKRGKEKNKEGQFFSRAGGEEIFTWARQKVNSLILIGPTLDYQAKMQEFGIHFTEKVFTPLHNFITAKQQILHWVAPEETLLSAIKVYQALTTRFEYQKQDSYLFMQLSALARPEIQQRVMNAFASKRSHHLLVIEGTSAASTVSNLYPRLSKVLTENPQKKIIFITQEKDALAAQFKTHFKDKTQVENDTPHFSDLTPTSQSTLLKTTVNFQGQPELLSRLLGIDDPKQLSAHELNAFDSVIDSSTLAKLIKKESIVLGGEPLHLSSLEAVYIKRYVPITPEHLVDALESEQTLFVISASEQSELNKQTLIERFNIVDAEKRHQIARKIGTLTDTRNPDNLEEKSIFILSGRNKDNEHDFKQLCHRYPHHRVHWIEVISNGFTWNQFYDPNFYISRHFNRPNKVAIKSEVKQQLVEKNPVDLWVISGLKQADSPFDLPLIVKKARKTFEQLELDFLETDSAESKGKERIDILQQRLSALLAISAEQATTLRENIDQETVVLVEQEEDAAQKFNRLIERHPKKSVHWLKAEVGFMRQQLVWQRSHGILDGLRPYIDTDNRELYSVTEQALTIEADLAQTDNQRLKIIAGEPGMGKSTTLAHLSEQKNDLKTAWVIPLALKNCQTSLESLSLNSLEDTEQGLTEVIRFLTEAGVLGSKHSLTDPLLRYALTHPTTRPPLLLLDGFDEIAREFQSSHSNIPKPEHTPRQKVVRLLQFLKENTQAHLWVSTRKSQTEVLENGLSLFVTEFEKFLPEEQKRFLQDFWQNHLRLKYAQSELTTFAYTTFASVLVNKAHEILGESISRFIGIPLQVRILAEVYQEKFETHRLTSEPSQLNTLFNDLGLCNLYQRFIDTKYEIYFREKKQVDTRLDDSELDNLRRPYAKAHEQLALKLLFPEQAETLLAGKQERVEDDNLIRIGIVQSVNGKLEFLHRTFAEYFITTWLEHQLKKPQATEAQSLLIHSLMQPDYQATHLFLNSYAIKQLLTNNPLLKQFGEQIQRLWSDNRFYNQQGQTALHIAARAGHSNIIEFLFKSLEGYRETLQALIEAVDLNNRTPLHWAASQGHTKVVKLLIQHGAQIEAVAIDMTPLHWAASQGHTECVKLLIDHGAQVEAVIAEKNWTPLHVAASLGHTEIVKLLIDHGAQIEAVNKNNWTPLHEAARAGHTKIVKLLIDHRAQIEAVANNNGTPLHFAAGMGHTESVKLLIQHGAQIEAVAIGNKTPLHLAAFEDHTEVVKLLIDHGAQIEVVDEKRTTPLHLAALMGHTESVKLLIQHGAEIEAVAKYNATPLHLAAYHGQTKTVKLLIDHGAQIEMVDEKHATPLHLAAGMGHTESVKLLIDHGAQIEAVAENNWTPLHFAAYKGHTESVKLLIENGAQIEAVDANNRTPLHLAAQEGHTESVKLLKQQGAQIEVVNTKNLTPLHWAAYKGHTESVKLLIDHGAQIEAVAEKNCTPLHLAAQEGHTESVKLLIDHGAQIEAVTKNNGTPLHLAAGMGHTQSVKLLIDHGAQIEAVDEKNRTPLHWAAGMGHTQSVKLLIDHGAQIEAVDENNRTPLHWAAQEGHTESVKLLIDHGAKIEAVAERHATPLHLAALQGCVEVVRLLVDKGAQIEAVAEDNETPLHLAALRSYTDIVKLLIQRGAQVNAAAIGNMTPLQLAIENEHSAIAVSLLNAGARVNELSDEQCNLLMNYVLDSNNENKQHLLQLIEGRQPAVIEQGSFLLHKAASSGNLNLVKILIADTEAVDQAGYTLLHLAVKHHQISVIQILLQHGAIFNAKTAEQKTPLDIAKQYHYTEAINLLDLIDSLFRGIQDNLDQETVDLLNTIPSQNQKLAVTNACDRDGRVLLHYAAQQGCLKVVEYLLDQKINANVIAKNKAKWTPLHYAAKCNHLPVVQALLKRHAFYGVQDGQGRKPLQLTTDQTIQDLLAATEKLFQAVQEGRLTALNNALEQGAEINAHDNQGRTVLHLAAQSGQVDSVEVLLQRNIDVDGLDNNRWTPLHVAAHMGQLAVVRLLLTRGTDFLAKNKHDTVLHRAVSGNNVDILQLILNAIKAKFADNPQARNRHINAKDTEGDTPLMWTAENGRVDAARILLNDGADVNAKNNDGITALDWSIQADHLEVAVVLLENNDIKLEYLNEVQKGQLIDYLVEHHAGEKAGLLITKLL